MRRQAILLSLTLLLAAMPASADTYPRQPGVDVENYRFELTLSDATDEIVGQTTVTFRLVGDAADSIEFDLIGKETGGEPGGMEVTEVRWIAEDGSAGEVAPFSFSGDRLRIPFDRPAADESRSVRVAYRGTPATGLKIAPTKHGDRSFFSDNWPIKARHWLPVIDHPYDKSMSEMVVTAPVHYQVISNGLLIEETDLPDGMRRTHWKHSVPIPVWLYALGVARFAVQHLGEVNDIPVQTWVYTQDRDAGFHDFAVPTPHALQYYIDEIGPFSYEKLANVQSNSVGGGMESATAIFYGDNSVSGERDERWRNVIIHEVAHQWWGNSVTEAAWDDVWLSEGFATYFTTLFVEHAYGRDEMVKLLERGRDYIFEFAEENPDYTIVHDNLDDMSKVTTGNIYAKGGWTLHMLRELLGTEMFWAGIRDYYARFQDSNATTDDFIRSMEEASGQDLGWFFDQWLHRGGAIEIDWGWSWDAERGVLTVSLDQVQPNGQPYRMPVDLLIVDDEGNERVDVLEIDSLNHEFAIELDSEPTTVTPDPALKILVRWSQQSP